ncbi:MAG: hypothetical protein Q7T33_01920 [Dehalococcoidia bacterium]|nr:hypothetical protein [Dehalococcoidia bacterium]
MAQQRRKDYQWVAITGRYSRPDRKGTIAFHGEPLKDQAGQVILDAEGNPFSSVGNYISDQRLSEGDVEAVIEFSKFGPYEACEVIVYYEPETKSMITAGLGAGGAFNVRYFDGREWKTHFVSGDRRNLAADVQYHLLVRRVANTITMIVDGVVIARTSLPFTFPESQIGLWCLSSSDIRIRDFRVSAHRPKAFVVMQFSAPYNELCQDVIKPVCAEFHIEVEREDETPGPGFIIQDVVRKIEEATLIIADITPSNSNVFFEVGYAYAVRRPTILVAERQSQLPFDVSGLRTLFYENTIAGKSKFEQGLRAYIDAILRPQGIP